jgi:hypothetical protein
MTWGGMVVGFTHLERLLVVRLGSQIIFIAACICQAALTITGYLCNRRGSPWYQHPVLSLLLPSTREDPVRVRIAGLGHVTVAFDAHSLTLGSTAFLSS